MKIKISGENKKRIELIEALAKELGLKTKRLDEKQDPEMTQKERSEKLYQIMEEMAKSGGLESIKDPIAWQKEIRKDKPLYGREE